VSGSENAMDRIMGPNGQHCLACPPAFRGNGKGEVPGGDLGAMNAVKLAQLGGVWGGSPMRMWYSADGRD